MVSHSICNNCGEFYMTIYTDSPDDTMTLPDQKSSSTGISAKNKIDRRSYRYQCPACGAVKPKISYNEENELTYRAFQLLADAKFEEADAAFDEVLAKYPENVEAYWGKVKAKYRVLYKKNAKEKMLPTCEKTDHGSVFKDENYQKAVQYADERIQAFLKKQANEIDRVRGLKRKKTVSVLLTSVLLLAVMAFGIDLLFRPNLSQQSSVSTLAYVINDDRLTCTVTGKGSCTDTDIVIPETIDGYTVTGIQNLAFADDPRITSIQIPSSVTSIGARSFRGSDQLTRIVVDRDNPYYCDMDGVLFNHDMTKLIRYPAGKIDGNYTIPDSVTTIGVQAFYYCTSLTSIVIPDSVTAIDGDAFVICENLTSIVIPNSVTSMGGSVFSSCTSLNHIVIPDSLTSIGAAMFSGCTSLSDIVIPDSITSIGSWAFGGCKALTSIEIPDSVTSIGSAAFTGCTSLTSIVLPESLTSIGDGAFKDCTSLESIALPESLTSIGDSAFRDCTSLTSIELPDGLTSIATSAFSGCTKLIGITVSDGNQHYCDLNGVLFNKNKTELICYPEGKTESAYTIPYGVTSIGDSAFRDCTSLTSIQLPDGVTSIGSSAFYNCRSLTSIVIPDSVTSIGHDAFGCCTSLTSIELPDSLTSIDVSAFYNCTSLTSIELPDGVTSIGSSAFYNCRSLTSIVIPDSMTSISILAFKNCTELTEIRYNGRMEQWQEIYKGTSWSDSTGNYTVICTDGTVAKDGTVTPN